MKTQINSYELNCSIWKKVVWFPFFKKWMKIFSSLIFSCLHDAKINHFPKILWCLGKKCFCFSRYYVKFIISFVGYIFFKKKVPHSLKLVVELISMGLNSITKYLFSLYLQTREKWWTKEQRRHEASKASWPGVQRRPDNKNKFWSKLILLSKKHRSHRPVENSIQEY